MIKKILISCGLLILLLFAFFLFLINTHIGLQWSVALVKDFAPGTLTIKQIKGRLIGPLSIEQLSYQAIDTHINIKTLEFDWHPKALLTGKLAVIKLYINNASIVLPASKTTSTKTNFKFHFPLSLHLQNIELKNITFQTSNNNPIAIDQVTADADTRGKKIQAELNAKIKAPQNLTLKLELNGTTKNYYLKLHAVSNTFNLNATAHGNQQQFIMDQLTGTLQNQPVQGFAQFNYEKNHIHNLNINLNAGNTKISAHGSITDQWLLNWKITIPNMNELIPDTQGSINTEGNITGSIKYPNILIKLIVNNLITPQLAAKYLNADINVQEGGSKTSSILIKGQEARWLTHEFVQLDINATGKLDQHKIDLLLTG